MRNVKIIKYGLISILILILTVIISVVLFFNYYPKDKALEYIISSATKTLKRKITANGIDYSLKGIILKSLSIYNGPTEKDELLFSADDAVLRFSLMSLIFNKNININSIRINRLYLNISFKDGRSNIEDLLKDIKGNEEPDSSGSANINNITLSQAKIILKNPPPVLKPLEGEYIIDGSLEFVDKNKIILSDSTITLPEKRGTALPELTLSTVDDSFEISGNVALEKVSMPWIYLWGTNLRLPYADVSGKVTGLKINKNMVEGFLKGFSTLTSKKQLLVNGYCKVSISSETVFLSNTQGSIQNSSFLVDEFLFNFSGDIKKFKIKDIDAQIIDVWPIISFLPVDLYGSVSGYLFYENAKYNGEININAGYNYKNKILREVKGTININNNIIPKTGLSMLLFDQPCSVFLSSASGDLKKFEINISSSEFKYPAAEKEDSPIKAIQIKLPVEISGRIDVAALQIDGYNFAKSSANFLCSGSRLSLSNVSSQFMGGDIKGKGEIDFSKEHPHMNHSVSFSNIKLQNIAKQSEKFTDRLFGSISGHSEIDFIIDENSGIFNSLKGLFEFNIEKGKFVNTGIQNGLGVLLEDLKYKLKDLEFIKIYGNISAGNGNFQINSFIFNAPDVRLNVNGMFNKDLAGDVKIDLEFTRNFVQDLPNPAVLLQLNKYKRNKWYVIPFELKGKDLSDTKNLKMLD